MHDFDYGDAVKSAISALKFVAGHNKSSFNRRGDEYDEWILLPSRCYLHLFAKRYSKQMYHQFAEVYEINTCVARGVVHCLRYINTGFVK